MYELKGEERALSGSGRNGTYWEHRYDYVRGYIRDSRDIQDLHEWSKEYADDTITEYTRVDLNFKGEVKLLKQGVYDEKPNIQSVIQDVARLYQNTRVYNSVDKLIKKAVKRVESGKTIPRIPSTKYDASQELHFEFKETGRDEYELPSGNKDSYVSLCWKAWKQEITDRADLKMLIEIAKSKLDSSDSTIRNLMTMYWYDELAGAFMNGLLCNAYITDRNLISRIGMIANCKEDKPVIEKYESERILKYSHIDWSGEKSLKDWKVLDDR